MYEDIAQRCEAVHHVSANDHPLSRKKFMPLTISCVTTAKEVKDHCIRTDAVMVVMAVNRRSASELTRGSP